jgi:hypothetical protein
VGETIPPDEVNLVSPELLGEGRDGHPVGTGSDLDIAMGSRFGSAVARLWIRSGPRWNVAQRRIRRHSANGTGFMVGPRTMLTAGHVVEPLPDDVGARQSFAAFFDRVGCIPKFVHFAPGFVLQERFDDSIDAGLLFTECHPHYGAPGEAFGRLYLRLWKMAHGQWFTVLGHTGGDILRFRSGHIERSDEQCKTQQGVSNCVRWGHTDWDLGGMSGGPLLDGDGAVRGIRCCSNFALPDDEKLAFRMDAAARWSNNIRQIVRDQSPGVWASAGTLALARWVVLDREWEATTQDWGRVSATPVPASALDPNGVPVDPTSDAHWPSGWSVFYVDDEYRHVLHLRTSNDGGERIPDVVQEDVSTLDRTSKKSVLDFFNSASPK